MKTPFFSIITCTLNSGKFLDQCLASVSRQTLKDYEHIFIDGLSRDGTVSKIKKYRLENLDKVKIFQGPPKGISNAMNEGIKRARGKYIYFLHSDDYLFDENVLADAEKIIGTKGFPDWAYGRICVVDERGKRIGAFPNRWFFKIASPYLLKFVNFVPHQATFVKLAVFKKYGLFDESLKYAMDQEYWLRIRDKTRWFYINRIIADFRIHEDAESSSKKNRSRNREILDEVKLRYLKFPEYVLYKLYSRFYKGRVGDD